MTWWEGERRCPSICFPHEGVLFVVSQSLRAGRTKAKTKRKEALDCRCRGSVWASQWMPLYYLIAFDHGGWWHVPCITACKAKRNKNGHFLINMYRLLRAHLCNITFPYGYKTGRRKVVVTTSLPVLSRFITFLGGVYYTTSHNTWTNHGPVHTQLCI